MAILIEFEFMTIFNLMGMLLVEASRPSRVDKFGVEASVN